jgi:hypothetical protein
MSRIEQVELLFHQALSLPSGAGRIAWLEGHCQGDSGLSQEVLSLLEAHAEMTSAAAAAPTAPPSETKHVR